MTVMQSMEQEVGDLLRQKGLTLSLIESASGGLMSHLITNVPGCSGYYKGSITAYSNQAKINLVGVMKETIGRHGAVSSQVAEEMANGGRKVFNTDICLADTGIAGPAGANKNKQVGHFYIGLSNSFRTISRKYSFQGNRQQNKQAAAEAALSWLREYLLGMD